ncbi:MAG: LysM peptidoglycan-binding domain-containing protein [Anaerolineae bacterium]|nr:LysM peptidoglycan-binding domain-containing protein [Anaerolineae bacterium]
MRLLNSAVLILVMTASVGCNLPQNEADSSSAIIDNPFLAPTAAGGFGASAPGLAARGTTGEVLTPTPDTPRTLPTIRSDSVPYTVKALDTVGAIANQFGISVQALIEANNLVNPDMLTVGQVLLVPAPTSNDLGPRFKIIPDSELVNGPAGAGFNIEEFILHKGGYLAEYRGAVGEDLLSGWEIVERVANFYSVNPRLLLALLEYQGGWLTQEQPAAAAEVYPMGFYDQYQTGLFLQLNWAADNLNRGYYLWRVNGVGVWQTTDGANIPIDATINAGTAGLQHFFSKVMDEPSWRMAVSSAGFFNTYYNLFGYPFDWQIEPLIPEGLSQPEFQLPFEPGVAWVFTGGPHGGWGDGSAWAALDFAPGSDLQGCARKDEWVTAVADGKILISDEGGVFQDLDGDDIEQTGWTVVYMHIDRLDRVQAGQFLHAGERIGHPSCEGGFSTAAHLHIARKYNGEWISADGPIPFSMDGWVTVGDGIQYGGALQKGERWVRPCECRYPENMVSR